MKHERLHFLPIVYPSFTSALLKRHSKSGLAAYHPYSDDRGEFPISIRRLEAMSGTIRGLGLTGANTTDTRTRPRQASAEQALR
jgi:hypothetical protein